MPHNIFIVALDDFQREELQTLPDAEQYRFHSLLTLDDVVHSEHIDLDALLDRARRQLDAFEGSVDAIIAHWDFPTTVLVPILCAERGLRAPSLESVLQCSHKYWSRVRQREAIPALTPEFRSFDPFDEGDLLDRLELPFPFWVKPVKAFSSHLGFKIENAADLDHAVACIREEIHRLGDPFDELLARAGVPDEVRAIGGTHCIAEEYLTGVEVAHEGHVFRGNVSIHGTLDMLRRDETFLGYEHPSELPREVLDRIEEAAIQLIGHIGFDNGVFNAEYFWNPRTDRLSIVEVNPRMSQSHTYLWDIVDGCSNHEIAIDIALDRQPRVHPGAGEHAKAGKMFLRSFEPGVVRRVPSDDDLARVRQRFPDCKVEVVVEQGQDLAALVDQDAYSFELAELYIAAGSRDELLARYDQICGMLPFEVQEGA